MLSNWASLKFRRLVKDKITEILLIQHKTKEATIFDEDLLRNIPAKFGPKWPSGLGGEDV